MEQKYLNNIDKYKLQKYVGQMRQVAGVREIEFREGRASGVKAVEVSTGSGFSFTVLPDRGMDIADATYCGKPLAWMSKNGITAPQYFENGGIGFLRSFSGGLITTCGLTQAGDPGVDGDEVLGIHGRISHIPAENYEVREYWDDCDYRIEISGRVRESCLYKENLVLKREIRCSMGESRVTVADSVENQGFCESPFMLLYHINLGYPIVSEDSRLYSSAHQVTPWNEDAMKGDGLYDKFETPAKDYQWQAFLHHMPEEEERVYAAVVNEELSLGVYVSYRQDQLPCFNEWKMMGQQDYVVGLEPGINIPEGRLSARDNGTLRTLKPGETYHNEYEIGVLDGPDEIKDFVDKL